VQTVHGLDGQRAKWGPLARALLGFGTWCSARYPDATIVVSDALRRHYAESYGRATWRIANGVTAPERHPTPALIRDRWKLHADGYALFVGRLVPEKAPDQLVEAFTGLPGQQRLVLVGASAYTDDYAARLRRLADRDPRVVLTGHVHGEPLAELYANASCFVLPSLLEGLPLTLLEAISFGLPVVVSDIDPHLEIVHADGPGHRVFRAGETADLRRALRLVRAAPADELVGAAALREHVIHEYDWDVMAERVAAVYREVARAPRARRPGRLRSAVQRGEARREIVAQCTDPIVDLEQPSR
jgi:glycosyltransferase involved in cell wall biosynthesis